jgi:uncharacterized protein with PQ loop repeat
MNNLETIFGACMTICFNSAFIPQIVKIYKTKKSDNISYLMLFFCLTANLAGIGLAVVTNNAASWFIINYIIGVCTTIMLLVVCIKYRK